MRCTNHGDIVESGNFSERPFLPERIGPFRRLPPVAASAHARPGVVTA